MIQLVNIKKSSPSSLPFIDLVKQQTNRETLAPNMDPMEKAERYLQSVQISPVRICVCLFFFDECFLFSQDYGKQID
jgi:hypothetical protein